MKYHDASISKNGIKLGDFVLVNKINGYYGRVIRIMKRTHEKHDWQVNNGKHKVCVGEELASSITVTKVINLDLTTTKRQVTSVVSDDKITNITKEFISKMFRKLNDTAAYIKMINEQSETI